MSRFISRYFRSRKPGDCNVASTLKILRPMANGLFLGGCLILVLQAAASRMVSIDERSIPLPGLHELPMQLGNWTALSEGSLDRDVTAYLKPDEYIIRDYRDASGKTIDLFVAYFKSLQNTYGPHSPRICLPGNGWLVRSSKIEPIAVPGRTQPISVNEFSLEKAGDRILVLYWYQNDRNVWAEEFEAKLRLLPDLIRYRRADVSLVRLVMPMPAESGKELSTSIDFARLVFPRLVERFANTK